MAGLIALIISIYILWQIRLILLLTFAAVALATAINCLVDFSLGKGVKKRGTAIVLSVLLLFLVFISFILLIIPPFIDQVQHSLYLLPEAADKISAWLTWLQGRVPKQLVGEIQKLDNLTSNLPSVATKVFGNFFDIFSGSLGAVVNILLVGVVTIMLLVTPHPYLRLFLALFPAFYRRRAAKIIKKSKRALVGWTQGILFNMFAISLSCYAFKL